VVKYNRTKQYLTVTSTERRPPMSIMHYIGFDIHKKVISFCGKMVDGTFVDQGVIHICLKTSGF
jgi:hypothetical protein